MLRQVPLVGAPSHRVAGRARLAQAPPPNVNRLLTVPLKWIIYRRWLLILEPSIQGVATSPSPVGKAGIFAMGWPTSLPNNWPQPWPGANITPWSQISSLTGWPEDVIQTFYEISQQAISDEPKDLETIDQYFSQPTDYVGSEPSMIPDPTLERICDAGVFYPYSNRYRQETPGPNVDTSGNGLPQSDQTMPVPGGFWCSGKSTGHTTLPAIIRVSEMTAGFIPPSRTTPRLPNVPWPAFSENADFWGVDLDGPWGNVKPWIGNLGTANDVLAKYPFPQPFADRLPYVTRYALPGLRTLVQTPVELAPEDIEVWLTFAILGNWQSMVNDLNRDLKAEARSEREQALITTIAAVVVGVVTLGAGLPAIIGAIAGSAVSTLNKINEVQLQKDLSKVQDAFQSTDPGFAGEIGKSKAYVQRLSDALSTAIDKNNVQRTLAPGGGVSTGLYVAGGVAAAAAVAFAIFRSVK